MLEKKVGGSKAKACRKIFKIFLLMKNVKVLSKMPMIMLNNSKIKAEKTLYHCWF